MELTTFEGILIGVAIVEAIAVIVLWLKKNAAGSAVILEPGKDKLQVDYYYIDDEKLREGYVPAPADLERSDQSYIYFVEGVNVLVSKEKSLIVTTETGAEDTTPGTGMKVVAIRPPAHLRRPPATLMAIEIRVVS